MDGASVALNGNSAFLGSYTAKGGVAFMFDRVGNSWTLLQKLVSPAGPGTAFAGGGAFGGGILAIGEPYDAATSLESVYFYDLSSGLWNEIQSVSQDSYFGDFGIAVAMNQNLAVIGAPYTAGLQGTAFIYSKAAN
jgi:hypothetical protein